ncbi:MAG: hypothetical protein NKF70_02345 [Methanobacterium sp. ERen5]|nr:MAG: hypothetical protein NKF70_02345 [Methanobacterium sp. ERen5]
MNKSKIGIIIILIIVMGSATAYITRDSLMSYAFNQMNYNYTGYTSIPNNTHNGGSLGGTYNVYGKGEHFNFKVDMKGADQYEDPLCYTSSGLTGNGTVDTINVTSNTVKDLFNRDFKSAMFETPVTGHFDMKCAAWTGFSNFTNNGTDFIGYFKINGPMTDFEGTYRFVPQGTRIAVVSSYLWWNVNSTNKTQINKTYYI